MEKNSWTIPDLLQLSGGYWATCALHAAVRLDLFSPLAGATLSVRQVASACKSDPRAIGMLLDALVSIELLKKDSTGYAGTEFSSTYLARNSPEYLGHIVQHHHHLVSSWAILHEAVISGEPVRDRISHGDDLAERESFLMGMFNLASQLAPRIAAIVDLSGCRRLLDLGGGPGTYAIHFCRQNPELTAVVFDLPATRFFAESTIDRYALSDRISFTSGDYCRDTVPSGFDVAWLSHILHSEGVEGCGMILQAGAKALNPGGMLLVQEFILNDAKDGPPFPALFSLNMLLGTAQGQSYAESDLRGMMTAAGLIDVRRLPVELPNGAGIMAGRVR